MAKQMPPRALSARPPLASVPAFGGWEGGAAAPDYSLDFTNIRAARMQRRRALSWSSFVAAVDAEEAPAAGGGGRREEDKRQWSSAASDDGEDDRRPHRHRRLRSSGDDRQPIRPPGRHAAPKGRSKLKGYMFGCVGGLW